MPDYERGPLPGAADATADERKFTRYLLNFEHPQGRGKAKMFAAAGYTVDNWEDLRNAILEHVQTAEALFSRENDYGGEHWEVGLTLAGPEGTIGVRTFWEVHPEGGTRLITAYAGD